MKPHFDLTEEAVRDLVEIGLYTKNTSGEQQASRYRQEVDLALQKLSLMPTTGRLRDELAPGIRSHRVAGHIAFYVRRKKGGITIIRLLHPQRDVESAVNRSKQIENGNDEKTLLTAPRQAARRHRPKSSQTRSVEPD